MSNRKCALWHSALHVDRNGVNGVHASQDHIHSPRFGRRPNAQLCTVSAWLTCAIEDRQTSPIHGLQLLLGRKRVVLLEQLIKPACTRTHLGSHVHRSLLPHVHIATGSQKVAVFHAAAQLMPVHMHAIGQAADSCRADTVGRPCCSRYHPIMVDIQGLQSMCEEGESGQTGAVVLCVLATTVRHAP